MSEFRELLAKHWARWEASFPVDAASVSLGERELAALEAHFDLLVLWNRRTNLSSVRDAEGIVVRHFCESLALASVLPMAGSVVDLGSGGGFPGVPVAVVRPGCSVTLVDIDVKKAVFLKEASLELPNVRVARVRADELVGSSDWLISRAVAWRDVARAAARTSQVAVLVGAAQSDELPAEWKRLSLPWADRTVLAFGQSDSH